MGLNSPALLPVVCELVHGIRCKHVELTGFLTPPKELFEVQTERLFQEEEEEGEEPSVPSDRIAN